jgi:hypothetical protein
MFPNEHPAYVQRRLEAQNVALRRLAKQMETVDVADPAELRKTIAAVAAGMAEICVATGSLAQWVVRNSR